MWHDDTRDGEIQPTLCSASFPGLGAQLELGLEAGARRFRHVVGDEFLDRHLMVATTESHFDWRLREALNRQTARS